MNFTKRYKYLLFDNPDYKDLGIVSKIEFRDRILKLKTISRSRFRQFKVILKNLMSEPANLQVREDRAKQKHIEIRSKFARITTR